MNLEIKKINPEDTLELREKILRPGQALNRLVYTGDYYPEAYHAGAFLDNKIIGIATVYRKAKDGENKTDSWQLRGMAVSDGFKGKNIGKRLLESCIDHIRSYGENHLWCNARVSAQKFYEKMGFKITSEEFQIPDMGPHYIMEIDLK